MKTILYLCGALAAAGFLLTKNSAALEWATSGSYRYGDLYRMAPILRFKPPAPLPEGRESQIDSVDRGEPLTAANRAIFFGDSFGFCDWSESPFHAQLGRALGLSMYQVGNNHHARLWGNPYRTLAARQNAAAAPGVLFYEISERSIATVFAAPLALASVPKPEYSPGSWAGRFKAIEGDLLDNTEERHEILLKHSVLTRPLVSRWDSAVFACFRQVPDETPWYSVDAGWLFYGGEVGSFRAEHGDEMVAKTADNIALISQNLRTHFRCTLVFIPVPNKVTLYSRLATSRPYDDFLPRLCRELMARGVRTVDLLPRFRREKELLYWPTDTHWNNAGIRAAVQETVRQLPSQSLPVAL